MGAPLIRDRPSPEIDTIPDLQRIMSCCPPTLASHAMEGMSPRKARSAQADAAPGRCGKGFIMVAVKAADVDAFVARSDSARRVVLVFGPDAGLVSERVRALLAASVDDMNDPFAL